MHAAAEVVAADEVRVPALDVERGQDRASEHTVVQPWGVALENGEDSVGVGVLHEIPARVADLPGRIAADDPGQHPRLNPEDVLPLRRPSRVDGGRLSD